MSLFIWYLLKLSISLAIIWLFYQLMLRRLTFYNLNRWYLLGYSLLCFIIPFINIGLLLEKESFQGSTVVQYIPVIGDFKEAAPDPGIFSRVSPWHILSGVLILGSVVLLIRLGIRWLSLRQVRRKALLITGTGVKIFQVAESILPFSFGNAIYVNPQLHTEKEYSAIILHEYVHIRQKHTVDILLAELICIANWYNPFAWLIRYSIRQNLEFIADRKVLEHGLDKKGYQYHLLQVVGAPAYRLANNFKFSSLKKRIIMMNKIKSAKLQLIKFLFIVPLLATLLLAFRDKIGSVEVGDGPVAAAAKVSGGDTVVINGDVMIDNNLYSFKDLKLTLTDSLKRVLKPDVLMGSRGFVSVMDTTPAKAGPVNAKPLYVIDGVQMPDDWDIKDPSISPDDIKSIEVLKNEQAIRFFGPRAVNGVVVITTKKSKLPAPAVSKPSLSVSDGVPGPARLIDHAGSLSDTSRRSRDTIALPTAKPLYYIDGVEASEQQLKVMDPHDIESINVFKGDSAVLKYGEKGRNGVILIRMKVKGTAMEQRIRVLDQQRMQEDQRKMVEDQVAQRKELEKRVGDLVAQQKQLQKRMEDEQKMTEDQRKLVEAQMAQQKELQKRVEDQIKMKEGIEQKMIEDQRKMEKTQRTVTMIIDNKTGEKMAIQADTIIWKKKKGDTKEYVGFVNGVRAPKGASVESLVAREDMEAIENVDNKDILAKYGFAANRAIVNIITRANKDNPAAYMLGGR